MNSHKIYSLAFLLVYIAFIYIHISFTSDRLSYDSGRNQKVISELVYYGTYTYFDSAYLVNPPLYYFVNAIISSVMGVKLQTFIFIEATLFFLGALIAFFICREFGLSPKQSLLAFFLILIDKFVLWVHTIDFWGINVLFSALLIYAYIRFLKSPKKLNMLFFGIVIGLSMLTKSPFIFLIAPLITHYIFVNIVRRKPLNIFNILIAAIIALFVYSPWLHYLSLNGFPIINNPEAQGVLLPGYKEFSLIDIYKNIILDHWPIIYLLSIFTVSVFAISYFAKNGIKVKAIKEKLGSSPYLLYSSLLIFIIVLYPIFNRLIINSPAGEGFVSVMVAAYLAIVLTMFKFGFKIRYIIGLILIINAYFLISSFTYMPIQSLYVNTCPLHTEFLNSLSDNVSILVDQSPTAYPHYNIMHKPFFEFAAFSADLDVPRLLLYNIDYIIVNDKSKIPDYLNTELFSLEKEYICNAAKGKSFISSVYKVNREQIAKIIKLNENSTTGLNAKLDLLISGDNKPIQAWATLFLDNLRIPYKSKRDGSISLYVPEENIYRIRIERTGYVSQEFDIEIKNEETDPVKINLKKDTSFIVKGGGARF